MKTKKEKYDKIIDKILKGDLRMSGDFDYDEMCEAINQGSKMKPKTDKFNFLLGITVFVINMILLLDEKTNFWIMMLNLFGLILGGYLIWNSLE